ncbi:hypothetical protein B5180_37165, partial [Streptomyces sp. BF-3]
PPPVHGVRRRLRHWAAAPSYAWLTAAALTLFAVVELALVPSSAVTAFGVVVCTASLALRATWPAVGFLT